MLGRMNGSSRLDGLLSKEVKDQIGNIDPHPSRVVRERVGLEINGFEDLEISGK